MTTEIKETAPKTESQFFVVETAKKLRDNCVATLKDYNEKYVKNAVGKGKNFAEGIKNDARTLSGNLAEKGKKYASELPVVKTVVEKGKQYASQAPNLKTVVEKGKQYASESPLLKKAEKKISKGLSAVRDKINLPAKEDIEKLSRNMELLNSKVDVLSRKHLA
jgi:polyhydroxyalkanoate synthesis regulator phasin